MKKEMLKKMKYEMPGMAKGKKGPAEEEAGMELEISMEEPEETGMPEMAMEEPEMEGEGEEEMEMPDLSLFSEEELMAELKKRKAKPAMA
jgi:hypothetical protein